jgi:hypothetical protein
MRYMLELSLKTPLNASGLCYSGGNMPRTKQTARKKTTPRKPKQTLTESDGEYLLKLVISILFGTFWLKFKEPLMIGDIHVLAIPVGLFVGLLLVHRFEKYQSDRKIWYAVIIIVGIICANAPAGIVL